MSAPTLIFGWGNPSRGDDALGPLLIERVEALKAAHPEWGAVDLLVDFQLQVEHALDLEGRERVLFVDASAAAGAESFSVRRLTATRDATFTSHAMSAPSVMQVYADMMAKPPPPCALLAIGGESFELGEPLSDFAAANLGAALDWTVGWLAGDNAVLEA